MMAVMLIFLIGVGDYTQTLTMTYANLDACERDMHRVVSIVLKGNTVKEYTAICAPLVVVKSA